MFEKIYNQIPEKGDLLISEPFLPDPNFERTVIYLCEHNNEGSFGFVLNKVSLLRFDDVIQSVENIKVPLYIGGPVQQDTLHFLHRSPKLVENTLEVCNGIFWSGDTEKMINDMEMGLLEEKDFKFFLGYSGWGTGQLEAEIKEKSWIIYKKAESDQIFDIQPDILWRHVLKSMGGEYKIISNYPTDPRLN
jgi:putative transcriptional regulator